MQSVATDCLFAASAVAATSGETCQGCRKPLHSQQGGGGGRWRSVTDCKCHCPGRGNLSNVGMAGSSFPQQLGS